MDNEHEHHPPKIRIFINDQPYFVTQPTMTGAEIKKLGNIPMENWLFKEEPGVHPDVRIADDQVVELKPGLKFYDLPPAQRGYKE
jgi:hypothetical protein